MFISRKNINDFTPIIPQKNKSICIKKLVTSFTDSFQPYSSSKRLLNYPVKAEEIIFDSDARKNIEKIILANHPDIYKTRFDELWSKSASNRWFDAPVTVSKDKKTAYIGGTEKLVSVNISDGKTNFETPLPGQVFLPPIENPNGDICLTFRDFKDKKEYICLIDRTNGKKIWQVNDDSLSTIWNPAKFASALAVTSDNKIFAGTHNGSIRMYDGNSGKLLNEIVIEKEIFNAANGGFFSSIFNKSKKIVESKYHISIDNNDNLFVNSFNEGIIYVVNGKNASLEKKINLRTVTHPQLKFDYPPVIGEDGKIYFSDSFSRSFYAYDTASDKLRWKYTFQASACDIYINTIPPVLDGNGNVLLCLGKEASGGIACVYKDSGILRWKIDRIDGVTTPPVYTDDGKNILVGANSQNSVHDFTTNLILAIDPVTGLVKGEYNATEKAESGNRIFGPGCNLALADDNVLIAGFENGKVIACKLSDDGLLKNTLKDSEKNAISDDERKHDIINSEDCVIIDGMRIPKKNMQFMKF